MVISPDLNDFASASYGQRIDDRIAVPRNHFRWRQQIERLMGFPRLRVLSDFLAEITSSVIDKLEGIL